MFYKKFISSLSTVLLLAISFAAVYSQDSVNSGISALIEEGIIFTINQDFEAATTKFKQIQALDSDDPAGYFYEAAALQAEMMDSETELEEDRFFQLLDKTIDLAGKKIRKNGKDAWAHFYLGSAFCYKGFYLARKKKWLLGLQNAWQGVGELQKAVALDSTLYDAYLGIGSYKYWRSRLTQLFNWLPFVPDERAEGIEMIRRALQKGRYSKYVAQNNLAWILIDAGQTHAAIALSQQGLSKFPHSRYFLWSLAEAYFRSGRYYEAVATYKRILDSMANESLNNHYNEIICRLKMAQAHFQLRHFNEAIKECDKIMATQLEKNVRKRLKEKIEMAIELKAKCEQKLNE